jgi:hypothetical protein
MNLIQDMGNKGHYTTSLYRNDCFFYNKTSAFPIIKLEASPYREQEIWLLPSNDCNSQLLEKIININGCILKKFTELEKQSIEQEKNVSYSELGLFFKEVKYHKILITGEKNIEETLDYLLENEVIDQVTLSSMKRYFSWESKKDCIIVDEMTHQQLKFFRNIVIEIFQKILSWQSTKNTMTLTERIEKASIKFYNLYKNQEVINRVFFEDQIESTTLKTQELKLIQIILGKSGIEKQLLENSNNLPSLKIQIKLIMNWAGEINKKIDYRFLNEYGQLLFPERAINCGYSFLITGSTSFTKETMIKFFNSLKKQSMNSFDDQIYKRIGNDSNLEEFHCEESFEQKYKFVMTLITKITDPYNSSHYLRSIYLQALKFSLVNDSTFAYDLIKFSIKCFSECCISPQTPCLPREELSLFEENIDYLSSIATITKNRYAFDQILEIEKSVEQSPGSSHLNLLKMDRIKKGFSKIINGLLAENQNTIFDPDWYYYIFKNYHHFNIKKIFNFIDFKIEKLTTFVENTGNWQGFLLMLSLNELMEKKLSLTEGLSNSRKILNISLRRVLQNNEVVFCSFLEEILKSTEDEFKLDKIIDLLKQAKLFDYVQYKHHPFMEKARALLKEYSLEGISNQIFKLVLEQEASTIFVDSHKSTDSKEMFSKLLGGISEMIKNEICYPFCTQCLCTSNEKHDQIFPDHGNFTVKVPRTFYVDVKRNLTIFLEDKYLFPRNRDETDLESVTRTLNTYLKLIEAFNEFTYNNKIDKSNDINNSLGHFLAMRVCSCIQQGAAADAVTYCTEKYYPFYATMAPRTSVAWHFSFSEDKIIAQLNMALSLWTIENDSVKKTEGYVFFKRIVTFSLTDLSKILKDEDLKKLEDLDIWVNSSVEEYYSKKFSKLDDLAKVLEELNINIINDDDEG